MKKSIMIIVIVLAAMSIAVPVQAAEQSTNDKQTIGALAAGGITLPIVAAGASGGATVAMTLGAAAIGYVAPGLPTAILDTLWGTGEAVIEGAGNIIGGVFALFGK